MLNVEHDLHQNFGHDYVLVPECVLFFSYSVLLVSLDIRCLHIAAAINYASLSRSVRTNDAPQQIGRFLPSGLATYDFRFSTMQEQRPLVLM